MYLLNVMKWCTLRIALIINPIFESRHQVLLRLRMLMMMPQWGSGRWLMMFYCCCCSVKNLVVHRLMLEGWGTAAAVLERWLDIMVAWLCWQLWGYDGSRPLLFKPNFKWRLTKNWIATLSVYLLLLLCRVCIRLSNDLMWLLRGSIIGDWPLGGCRGLRNLLVS
jgi:hypothetical protein